MLNFSDFIQVYVLTTNHHLKGLLHSFSTCIKITGNYWYCLNLKNVEKPHGKIQKG